MAADVAAVRSLSYLRVRKTRPACCDWYRHSRYYCRFRTLAYSTLTTPFGVILRLVNPTLHPKFLEAKESANNNEFQDNSKLCDSGHISERRCCVLRLQKMILKALPRSTLPAPRSDQQNVTGNGPVDGFARSADGVTMRRIEEERVDNEGVSR
jgi:hypothetical protein